LDHGIKYAFAVILTGIAIVTIITLAANFGTSDFAKGSLSSIPINNETKKLVIVTDTSKNVTVKVINQGGSQINAVLFVEIRNVVNGSYTNVEVRYANYIEAKPYSDKIMDYNPPLQKGKEYWLAVFLRQSEEPYGLAYAEEHNEIFTVKP